MSRNTGNRYEQQALRWLQAQGYGIVCRNYFSPFGEVDIIAKSPDGDLCFVEVRFRSANPYAEALHTVSRPKQRRIIKTALHFLSRNSKWRDCMARFDIISYDGNQVSWLKNAFSAD